MTTVFVNINKGDYGNNSNMFPMLAWKPTTQKLENRFCLKISPQTLLTRPFCIYSVLSQFYDVSFKKHCKTQTVLSQNAQKTKLLNKVARLRSTNVCGLTRKILCTPSPKSRKIFERKIRSALARSTHSHSYQSPLSLCGRKSGSESERAYVSSTFARSHTSRIFFLTITRDQ